MAGQSTMRRRALRRAGMPPGAPRRRRWWPRRRWLQGLLVLALGGALLVGSSLAQALMAPGTDSAAARLAEWARFHGLGWVVSDLEQAQYALSPPAVGGTPTGGIPQVQPDGPATAAGPQRTAIPRPEAVRRLSAAPAPLTLQAQPPLPGEGRWQTLVQVHGDPAIRAAFLRPDSVHTSYVTGVAWLDQHLLRFSLHPGTQVPGGTGWPVAPTVPRSARSALIATFNSGFTMQDARGGYWQGGQQVGTLRRGAAAMVFYRDGHLDVVKWGRDARLGPDVVAVRQNLDLLVDGGRLSPDLDSTTTSTWGKTLGNRAYVWRSAVGVRADGSVVVVVGASLSVRSLATLVRDAGAVRAMELDINTSWTNFMTYTHPSPGTAVPHMLTSDERPRPDRYLYPSSRDFVSVVARP
ncbi:phosphodiester glycosidase family protein [Oryzihumus sp.]|uniref:phosphodiester glycosidase family protein n=1 Tax=Oryzihumus sp. TaxID=1968903 RepID=UPI002EDA47B2